MSAFPTVPTAQEAAAMSMQAMRASDLERDRVVEIPKEQTANGRLSLDELEQRAGAAYAARTRLQLQRLTEDLPGTIPFGQGERKPDAANWRRIPAGMRRCLAVVICCCGPLPPADAS